MGLVEIQPEKLSSLGGVSGKSLQADENRGELHMEAMTKLGGAYQVSWNVFTVSASLWLMAKEKSRRTNTATWAKMFFSKVLQECEHLSIKANATFYCLYFHFNCKGCMMHFTIQWNPIQIQFKSQKSSNIRTLDDRLCILKSATKRMVLLNDAFNLQEWRKCVSILSAKFPIRADQSDMIWSA